MSNTRTSLRRLTLGRRLRRRQHKAHSHGCAACSPLVELPQGEVTGPPRSTGSDGDGFPPAPSHRSHARATSKGQPQPCTALPTLSAIDLTPSRRRPSSPHPHRPFTLPSPRRHLASPSARPSSSSPDPPPHRCSHPPIRPASPRSPSSLAPPPLRTHPLAVTAAAARPTTTRTTATSTTRMWCPLAAARPAGGASPSSSRLCGSLVAPSASSSYRARALAACVPLLRVRAPR